MESDRLVEYMDLDGDLASGWMVEDVVGRYLWYFAGWLDGRRFGQIDGWTDRHMDLTDVMDGQVDLIRARNE